MNIVTAIEHAIKHNMDTSRLDVVTKKDQERVKKYIRCHNYLTEIDNK